MRTAPAIFGRTPGTRPAVVGGLINGVAIGTPLLVGAASGEPAAGALTCIGAYIAAFTKRAVFLRDRRIWLTCGPEGGDRVHESGRPVEPTFLPPARLRRRRRGRQV